MKKILILKIITLAFFCMACGDNCEKTTYRPEVGVGFVFKETDSGLIPVKGAKITVENRYWTPGMYGASLTVVEESYTTNAEGRYQVRFVERGCWTKSNGDKEMMYCNLYDFWCENKNVFGFFTKKIENFAQNNILILDTIKIIK